MSVNLYFYLTSAKCRASRRFCSSPTRVFVRLLRIWPKCETLRFRCPSDVILSRTSSIVINTFVPQYADSINNFIWSWKTRLPSSKIADLAYWVFKSSMPYTCFSFLYNWHRSTYCLTVSCFCHTKYNSFSNIVQLASCFGKKCHRRIQMSEIRQVHWKYESEPPVSRINIFED